MIGCTSDTVNSSRHAVPVIQWMAHDRLYLLHNEWLMIGCISDIVNSSWQAVPVMHMTVAKWSNLFDQMKASCDAARERPSLSVFALPWQRFFPTIIKSWTFIIIAYWGTQEQDNGNCCQTRLSGALQRSNLQQQFDGSLNKEVLRYE